MEKSKRFLLKLSGEVMGDDAHVFSFYNINHLVNEIKSVIPLIDTLAIVIGGGNIARGKDLKSFKIPRARADHIGMLATCINTIMLVEQLKNAGIEKVIGFSALKCGNFLEAYSIDRAKEKMDEHYILVFGMGTGNPFFSTDTVAVIRAIELGIPIVLKGTKVDGVYNRDPVKFKDAKRFDKLSYQEVIEKRLNVMDLTAFQLARENGLEIRVFDITKPDNLRKAIISPKDVATIVRNAF